MASLGVATDHLHKAKKEKKKKKIALKFHPWGWSSRPYTGHDGGSSIDFFKLLLHVFNFFSFIIVLLFSFILNGPYDTCHLLKGVDVDSRQFLDKNTISIFSHKQYIIYDAK
jgi:hypothetical protein